MFYQKITFSGFETGMPKIPHSKPATRKKIDYLPSIEHRSLIPSIIFHGNAAQKHIARLALTFGRPEGQMRCLLHTG
jgi:hypothetical protein